jgi:hypothetical protein
MCRSYIGPSFHLNEVVEDNLEAFCYKLLNWRPRRDLNPRLGAKHNNPASPLKSTAKIATPLKLRASQRLSCGPGCDLVSSKPEVEHSVDSWCKQANAYSIGARDQRCDLEPIVNRVTQILLAAQISLRGLDRDMAQQELNLFQFAAASVAQLGAGPTQVMWG